MDLALNKLQRLICYKTQQTNQPTNQILDETVFFTDIGKGKNP